MLRSIRHLSTDLGHWLAGHRAAAAIGAVVLAAGIGIGGYRLGSAGDDQTPGATESAGPGVVTREVTVSEEPEDVGVPAFATKNTTRVAGTNVAADAAAVALAVYPATGGIAGPDAVTLVDGADWPGGIAAAALVADPIGAPLLVSESGEIGALTASALSALAPAGSPATAGHQAFVLGNAAKPGGLDSLQLDGDSAAELAAEVARLREKLAGKPEHLVVASADQPAFAMPAAGWAARSGDPVLFAQRNNLPAPTARAVERYNVPVYVLGPQSAISADTMGRIEKLAPRAERIGADDPVGSSIEFARFAGGSFGWNINDPGHGFVIASAERPLDAAVAAPLSAAGTWGPLLVTEGGDAVPAPLRGYLLDLKPGYEQDPTRALYNHVWLLGDGSVLSVDFQAQVDELAELAPVRSGGGSPPLSSPGATESSRGEPEPDQSQREQQ